MRTIDSETRRWHRHRFPRGYSGCPCLLSTASTSHSSQPPTLVHCAGGLGLFVWRPRSVSYASRLPDCGHRLRVGRRSTVPRQRARADVVRGRRLLRGRDRSVRRRPSDRAVQPRTSERSPPRLIELGALGMRHLLTEGRDAPRNGIGRSPGRGCVPPARSDVIRCGRPRCASPGPRPGSASKLRRVAPGRAVRSIVPVATSRPARADQ
jgi:hypothetical protein